MVDVSIGAGVPALTSGTAAGLLPSVIVTATSAGSLKERMRSHAAAATPATRMRKKIVRNEGFLS